MLWSPQRLYALNFVLVLSYSWTLRIKIHSVIQRSEHWDSRKDKMLFLALWSSQSGGCNFFFFKLVCCPKQYYQIVTLVTHETFINCLGYLGWTDSLPRQNILPSSNSELFIRMISVPPAFLWIKMIPPFLWGKVLPRQKSGKVLEQTFPRPPVCWGRVVISVHPVVWLYTQYIQWSPLVLIFFSSSSDT